MVIGKASFDEKQLAENYGAGLDEVLRHKPSSSKGRYLKKITASTTTGPGTPVDPSITRNVTEARGFLARADAKAHFRSACRELLRLVSSSTYPPHSAMRRRR
jgi:hypothetical protein